MVAGHAPDLTAECSTGLPRLLIGTLSLAAIAAEEESGSNRSLKAPPACAVAHVSRAPMSHQKYSVPGRSWSFNGDGVPRVCSDWHLNCPVRIGLTWPGTRMRRLSGFRLARFRFAGFRLEGFDFPTFRGIKLMRGSMTKYKLEYIWLDGYTPTPRSARQRHRSRNSTLSRRLNSFAPMGLRWLVDHAGRRPQLRLRAEAGRDRLSGRRAHQWRACDVRSHDARWQDPACHQQACDDPG